MIVMYYSAHTRWRVKIDFSRTSSACNS